ncbi:hypothetical protein [Myxococcus stipitatus]|uniref:hypothetical protein n=1 Tax=Myxococcus stipitatus TaxID=83455 RepID=UPI0030D384C9
MRRLGGMYRSTLKARVSRRLACVDMISADYPLASWFLAVSTTFFRWVFALPLLLIPLRRARWYGWGHVWGALRKAQPMSETVETFLYAGVGVMALWLRFRMLG